MKRSIISALVIGGVVFAIIALRQHPSQSSSLGSVSMPGEASVVSHLNSKASSSEANFTPPRQGRPNLP